MRGFESRDNRRRGGTRPVASGFTLIELMIAVTIIGILASLAAVGYRRYLARGRVTEAIAMLGEMSSKEQIYFLEFAAYLPLRNDGNIALPSPDESNTAFYPSDPNNAMFDSSRTATDISNPTLWPASWRSVGLRPKSTYLYCTYALNAGGGGAAVPGGGFGAQVFPAAPIVPWYYAMAACNLSGVAALATQDTVLTLTSNGPNITTFNDGM